MKNKKNILGILLVVFLLTAIAVVMAVIGRGHSVYLDCKALEYEGISYESPYKITAYVKDEQVAKLYDGERGEAKCMGQNFELTLKIMEKKNGPEETKEFSVKLPYNADGIIVNLNGLIAGLPGEAYMEEFVPTVVVDNNEEAPTDEGEDVMDAEF